MKRIIKVDEQHDLVLGDLVTDYDHEVCEESSLSELIESIKDNVLEALLGEAALHMDDEAYVKLYDSIDNYALFNNYMADRYIIVKKPNGNVALLID